MKNAPPFRDFSCGSLRGRRCLRLESMQLVCASIYGLNQTNMDNRFAFGLWIFLDLGVIALGAGAFFTGFLVYILKRAELKPILNTAVVVGFICYSGAVAILMIDVGQPLRAWFTFWHPNTHSMLTEVTFCISCYLLVLLPGIYSDSSAQPPTPQAPVVPGL